ncbi:NAD(P)/FAD-dependent oxidoreductase [Fredinandcohnia humi]
MNQPDIFDVTIIGGGPAGLYSAFYSGLRKMKTKLIEFQSQLGGKIHMYPEKMIWDVGGLTPISGGQLIDQLVQQGLTFDPTVVLNEKVVSITKNENNLFLLHAVSGKVHYSRAVIVAIGSGIIKPQKLDIEGAERFEISNLNYTVKSLQHFRDKTVIISGGGDTAIDWANELVPLAKQVIVTYRKESFTAHEAQISQLLNSSALCFFNTSITKLIANKNSNVIEKVELRNKQTGEVWYQDIDEVIVNHGFEQDAALLKDSELQIQIADNYYIAGNAMSESSVPGLYGAGDILKHEGKLHLIAGTFQDAANAVNKAKKFIEPDSEEYGMVSSHNELFKNKQLVEKVLR